jgi:predicted RNase H-like HicB family nuclease
MQSYTFRIIIEPDENNTFHGYAPALSGCHTWGNSIEEAKKNLDEAINLYVDSLIFDGKEVPEDNGFEYFITISTNSKVYAQTANS